MKKILISIVVLSMAIISLALTACSDKKDSSSGSSATKEVSKKSEKIDNSPNPESDFGFSTNDDFTEVYIGGYEGDRVHVVVPSEIQGVPVKSVKLSSQMIKSIVIPEGVISLRLDNCHFLSSIKLPNSLREVELEFLENLKSIELPEGLVIMEISATGITELKIPNSLEYIGHCINKNLESIIIPENFHADNELDPGANDGLNLSMFITGGKINSSIALKKQLKNTPVKALGYGAKEDLKKKYSIE